MNYKSTRNSALSAKSAEAIARGISEDGGLFVPESIPVLSAEDFAALGEMDYIDAAVYVLKKYLTDYTEDELYECAEGAYIGTFDYDEPAPLAELRQNVFMLELWHGPTCAFKDLALQILPFLLTKASEKTAKGETKVILVATSGDTGKAALEGFADVPGVKILTFDPEDGVSPMQKLQMITQQGENVGVCAIKGNFDDAQSGVKAIFTDRKIAEKLKEHNMSFSSANSINWGRLVPQIVYYVYSYATLLHNGDLAKDDEFNVVVPTGNFGNILAAYYAKNMGVPIKKLICASNKNNILTDFIKTGEYDRNRKFYTTLSPSMDILISSNLERLLFHLSGEDDEKVRELMEGLSKDGKYTVDGKIKEQIEDLFYAGCADDGMTKDTIHECFENDDYLADPHTAVAINVYEQYVKETGDDTLTVIASTASPFKFSRGVYEAVTGEVSDDDEFTLIEKLSEKTGSEVPSPLASLKDRKPRFTDCCEKTEMEKVVLGMLGIN